MILLVSQTWVTHRMLGLSQGKTRQDALSESEVKASPCPILPQQPLENLTGT